MALGVSDAHERLAHLCLQALDGTLSAAPAAVAEASHLIKQHPGLVRLLDGPDGLEALLRAAAGTEGSLALGEALERSKRAVLPSPLLVGVFTFSIAVFVSTSALLVKRASVVAIAVSLAIILGSVGTSWLQANAVECLKRNARAPPSSQPAATHCTTYAVPLTASSLPTLQHSGDAFTTKDGSATMSSNDNSHAPDEGSAPQETTALAGSLHARACADPLAASEEAGGVRAEGDGQRGARVVEVEEMVDLGVLVERLGALREKHNAGLLPNTSALIDWEAVEMVMRAHESVVPAGGLSAPRPRSMPMGEGEASSRLPEVTSPLRPMMSSPSREGADEDHEKVA